jgi:hypothetical protein
LSYPADSQSSPATELDEMATTRQADAVVDQIPAEPFLDFWSMVQEIEPEAGSSPLATPGSKVPSAVEASDSQPAMTGSDGGSVIGTVADVVDRPHLAQPNLILADDPNPPQWPSVPPRKAKSEVYIREKVLPHRSCH